MSFSGNHMKEVADIALKIDIEVIEEMINLLVETRKNRGRLFILGIGGSAGNASHAVNDFRKLANIESYAPTDNVSELTARTNDDGFQTVFEEYLRVSQLNANDCILILSVGGGDLERGVSTIFCPAINLAKIRHAKIIGIVGRENGYTHQNADICLVIPQVNPYAITPHSEAFQAIVWHLMVSHPKLKENETKW
jgi:D-sedoheptulose 7-phosphate isomerase